MALEPVASVLARGPVPLPDSAKIVAGICELLSPMHHEGQAHGAVAPENIYFHLVDDDLTLELRNEVVPGPAYFPPEQKGKNPTADVYALGVLFFI